MFSLITYKREIVRVQEMMVPVCNSLYYNNGGKFKPGTFPQLFVTLE